MQGVSGSSPLGSIKVFASYTKQFGQLSVSDNNGYKWVIMDSLLASSLANRFLGYIKYETVILTGYAKADLGKEITRSCEASTKLWLVCAQWLKKGIFKNTYLFKKNKIYWYCKFVIYEAYSANLSKY